MITSVCLCSGLIMMIEIRDSSLIELLSNLRLSDWERMGAIVQEVTVH